MKKTLLLVLVFALVFPLFAVNANKLYVQGITAHDPAKKMQLLEEWLSLFGNQKKHADKLPYVYLGLYDASLRLKRCDKIVLYGVKAIEYAKSDLDKPFIYARMADCYRKQKRCDKAVENFSASIQILKKILANPPKNLRVSKYKLLLADDLRLKGFCSFNLGKIDEGMKDMNAAANIYSQFGTKGKKRANLLMMFLFEEGKKYFQKGDYQTANKLVCSVKSKLDSYETYVLCAVTYEKLGVNGDKTTPLYIKAYNKKKNGALAYKIGRYYLTKCLGKDKKSIKDPKSADMAMNYLADAVVLLKDNGKQKTLYDSAYKLLSGIYKIKYFKAKEKPTLESILADARERVGK